MKTKKRETICLIIGWSLGMLIALSIGLTITSIIDFGKISLLISFSIGILGGMGGIMLGYKLSDWLNDGR